MRFKLLSRATVPTQSSRALLTAQACRALHEALSPLLTLFFPDAVSRLSLAALQQSCGSLLGTGALVDQGSWRGFRLGGQLPSLAALPVA